MNLLHLWLVHAPVWVAALIAMDVHQNGLALSIYGLWEKLFIAGLLGSLMGLLTAHAHGHYLSYIKDLL